eukprot:6930122-Karenia_brevis.AAC.1
MDLVMEDHLISPLPNNASHRWYTVLLNPSEQVVMSKTAELDNALTQDLPMQAYLRVALEKMIQSRGRQKQPRLQGVAGATEAKPSR